jgi:hypothetical protein
MRLKTSQTREHGTTSFVQVAGHVLNLCTLSAFAQPADENYDNDANQPFIRNVFINDRITTGTASEYLIA